MNWYNKNLVPLSVTFPTNSMGERLMRVTWHDGQEVCMYDNVWFRRKMLTTRHGILIYLLMLIVGCMLLTATAIFCIPEKLSSMIEKKIRKAMNQCCAHPTHCNNCGKKLD